MFLKFLEPSRRDGFKILLERNAVHHPIPLCIVDVRSPPAILEDPPPRIIVIIVFPTDTVFLSILDCMYVQNSVFRVTLCFYNSIKYPWLHCPNLTNLLNNPDAVKTSFRIDATVLGRCDGADARDWTSAAVPVFRDMGFDGGFCKNRRRMKPIYRYMPPKPTEKPRNSSAGVH